MPNPRIRNGTQQCSPAEQQKQAGKRRVARRLHLMAQEHAGSASKHQDQSRPGPVETDHTSPSRPIRVFVLPDSHIPHHDRKAFDTALRILRDFRPDHVVIIGDFCDLESLSHHPKNRPDITKLSLEYHECNLALDVVQNAAPSAAFAYLEGNHEYRATKFVNAQGELDGALDVAQNLHILPVPDARRHDDLRGITWLPFESYLGNAWVPIWSGGLAGYLHSAKANKGGFGGGGANHAAYHANTLAPISRCNLVVYGHNHTFQMFRSTAGYEAWCCGFLGDLTDKAFMYAAGPNSWLNGVLLQEIDVGRGAVTSLPVRISGSHAAPWRLGRLP